MAIHWRKRPSCLETLPFLSSPATPVLQNARVHWKLSLSGITQICPHLPRDGASSEKVGWARDKIDCQKVYLLFFISLLLGMNSDLQKVEWTFPPQSTPWRYPCTCPQRVKATPFVHIFTSKHNLIYLFMLASFEINAIDVARKIQGAVFAFEMVIDQELSYPSWPKRFTPRYPMAEFSCFSCLHGPKSTLLHFDKSCTNFNNFM